MERPLGGLAKRAVGSGRRVYVAGGLALTEPGPAAAGLVVADAQDRILAQRAHYLGYTTRAEATAQALLTAARLALVGGLEAPVFRVDVPGLVEALAGGGSSDSRSGSRFEGSAALLTALRDAVAQLPGHRLEVVTPSANLARAVALAPLVDWLPERTRRAEELRVQPLGGHVYAVESASSPGQVYQVTLRLPDAPGEGDPIQCECADFLYRGIPCKHLLAVARETGALERLFTLS